jgi:mannosyltransferase OCH1-like enzyme
MQIPKVINQIWNDQNIPAHFIPLIETWKENHPDWEYKLWTYDMSRDFIKRHDPEFLFVYDAYPRDIQRVDAARYFILKQTGGLFIDMDFECFKNISSLLDGQNCVLGMEPEAHCKMLGKDMIICNAFMACTPKNDFFIKICENLITDNRRGNKNMRVDVLESTGPFKLTEMYNNYDNKHQIKLLTPNTIYPLTMMETHNLLDDNNVNNIIQQKIDTAYALHYFLGSWWE